MHRKRNSTKPALPDWLFAHRESEKFHPGLLGSLRLSTNVSRRGRPIGIETPSVALRVVECMNALGRRVAESADDESKLLVFGQLPITGNGPFTSDSIELEFTGRYSCGRKVAGMSVRRGLEWLLAHDAVVDRPLYLFGKKGYRHGRGYSFRPSFDSSMTFSASAAVFQLADELAEFGTLLDIAFYFMNCRRDDFEKIIGDQWESIAADMPYHLREIEEWLEAVFQIKREGRK